MPALTVRPKIFRALRPHLLFALLLLFVVFFIYASALATSFFADDFNFLEPAARLDVPQYLVHYFDPRVQVLWYRPLQGIQILIEWWLFGANPVGYHVVQILIHFINCVWLWALVARVSKKPLLGFLAALFYATFPVYALAVNWINITDPMMTIFYLAAMWFWLNYLERATTRVAPPRDYYLALIMFMLALLFKQMALTLPAILFLLDVLLVASTRAHTLPQMIRAWLRRYFAFGVVIIIFFGAQSIARSTATFAGVFGYAVGSHIVSILAQYVALLVFPWGYFPATDTQIVDQIPEFIPAAQIAWLFLALAIYFWLVVKTRSRALVFVGLAAFITLAPVLPFPFIELRYLYLPALGSAILLAALFDLARQKFARATKFLAPLAFALLVLGASAAVADANAGIAEIARQRRVPFRDITRAHPTFPDDTRLYFIDPVAPITELTGLFTLRYGRGVTIESDAREVADLRAHRAAYVYYFDSTGKPIEIAVEQNIAARVSPALPAELNAPIRLDGLEIAQTTLARDEMLVVLLYWRARGRIEKDYTVFVHLVDAQGKQIAGRDSPPRNGDAPTREWKLNALVVDPILISIPRAAAPGAYRVEIGMYYLPTLERLQFFDAQGQLIADHLTLEPIVVK
ncbi:MAG: hypothetical protein HY070_13150 [Chloroflexi bacterium]|nr:hypothetical protein [Chloroflexota bacterium]